MIGTVIIASMERELRPLVAGWPRQQIGEGPGAFLAFVHGETAVIVSGIGKWNAERAALAALASYQPQVLISAGVAGALTAGRKAGDVAAVNEVVDAGSGASYACAGESAGGCRLVTAHEIAGAADKAELRERFQAALVDMEAAGVAQAAQSAKVEFRCMKAISDEADFAMPPLARFVGPRGNFQTGRFALWAALRPWHWASVVKLGIDTGKATRALCAWLARNVAGDAAGKVVTLDRPEFSELRTK